MSPGGGAGGVAPGEEGRSRGRGQQGEFTLPVGFHLNLHFIVSDNGWPDYDDNKKELGIREIYLA